MVLGPDLMPVLEPAEYLLTSVSFKYLKKKHRSYIGNKNAANTEDFGKYLLFHSKVNKFCMPSPISLQTIRIGEDMQHLWYLLTTG